MARDANRCTLIDVIVRNARMRGDAVAFRQSREVTHRKHLRSVEQLATGLHDAGIGRGDRIAILSRNRIEYLDLLGAAASLGAMVSAINWRLSDTEVAAVLESDEPKIVLVEDEFWPLPGTSLARGAGPEPVAIDHRRPGFRCLDDFYAVHASSRPAGAISADDPLLLIHTAWLDGRPKAAILSHANLLANALQLQCAWGLTVHDVQLCALPLFHSTAISLTLATQLAGGCTVFMPKYDAEQAATLIDRHRVTLLGEFAPMLEKLLASGDVPSRLRSLRHVCGLDSPQTIRQLEALCPDATFWTGYGQTEASGLVSLAPSRSASGSAGFPLPLCAIDIVDEEGLPRPCGEVGEIVVRGPSVFLGYWKRPLDNDHVFRGGCLHTGDSGYLDAEGRLFYSGRLAVKELIKTGGENVYPAEVEAVLREHPALRDAAVIGVPDGQWGEAVKAICTPAAGATLTEDEVIAFVAQRIARYKRPRSVVFVPALPKRPDGSNDRERIRQLYGSPQG